MTKSLPARFQCGLKVLASISYQTALGSTWDQPRYSDRNMFFNVQNSSGFREMSSGCAEFMFVVPRFCLGFDVPGLSASWRWFPLWRGMVNIQRLVVSACSIFTRPWGQEGWLPFGYLLFIPTNAVGPSDAEQFRDFQTGLCARHDRRTWATCVQVAGCLAARRIFQRRHVSISDLIFWSLGFWECFTWSTPEGCLAVLSKILNVERIVFADSLSSGYILCFCRRDHVKTSIPQLNSHWNLKH